jgi:cation transport protein ChaC
VVLTRDSIKNGFIDRMIAEGGGMADRWSEAQIRACYGRLLAEAPTKGDLWVFAYGSLIWNPAIHVVEERLARLVGYHRRFCLWTNMGRGSREIPGLILGLEPGGACAGVALRVERAAAEAEFDILFRREMVSGSYAPRWVATKIEGMRAPVPSLVFVMNRKHARYSGRLTEARIAESIAIAKGPLGACCDYLDDTVAALAARGIRDPMLLRMKRLVAARQAEHEEARQQPQLRTQAER